MASVLLLGATGYVGGKRAMTHIFMILLMSRLDTFRPQARAPRPHPHRTNALAGLSQMFSFRGRKGGDGISRGPGVTRSLRFRGRHRHQCCGEQRLLVHGCDSSRDQTTVASKRWVGPGHAGAFQRYVYISRRIEGGAF